MLGAHHGKGFGSELHGQHSFMSDSFGYGIHKPPGMDQRLFIDPLLLDRSKLQLMKVSGPDGKVLEPVAEGKTSQDKPKSADFAPPFRIYMVPKAHCSLHGNLLTGKTPQN